MNRISEDEELSNVVESRRHRFHHRSSDDPIDDDDDDDDDSCCSSSDDEDAHLKQIRPSTGTTIGLRRNDSFQSFLTRSERVHLLGPDPPPSPDEARLRTVQFRPDDTLTLVHLVERIDVDEEKDACFMTGSDFDRIETEVKLTTFRWENHVSGKIAFDETNNSTRGLEAMVDRSQQTANDLHRYQHGRAVLAELHRQKEAYRNSTAHGKTALVLDMVPVRAASEHGSISSKERARATGLRDEEDARRAWEEEGTSGKTTAMPTKTLEASSSKSKKRFFWQKNK